MSVVSHTYAVPANRGKIEALRATCGVACQLVTPRRWKDALTDVAVESRGAGDVVLPVRLAGRGAFYWMPPRLLHRAVAGFGGDLVHVEEEPFSVTALMCAHIARRLRVPLTVFTWENIFRRLPLPFEVIRRRVLSTATHVIAGNNEGAGLLKRWGYAGAVSVIPQLGVAPPEHAVRSTPDHNEFCIGYFGRLVPEKGVASLIDAVDALPGARLRLVGKGPEEDVLRERARVRGLANAVTFVGGVSHEAVPAQLAEVDVLVLPSLTTPRWKEQFGHVLVEAMTRGVPVVGSSSGAIPEVIGDAGLIFPEGDVSELAAVLRRLREYPALRGRLAVAGKARVESEYTDAVIARRTRAVWDAALAAGTATFGE